MEPGHLNVTRDTMTRYRYRPCHPVTHPVPGGHVIKVSTRSLIIYDISNDVTYGPLENEGNTKTIGQAEKKCV